MGPPHPFKPPLLPARGSLHFLFHPTCFISPERHLDFLRTISNLRNVTDVEMRQLHFYPFWSFQVLVLRYCLGSSPGSILSRNAISSCFVGEKNGGGCLFLFRDKKKEVHEQLEKLDWSLKPICWLPEYLMHHFRHIQQVPSPTNQRFLGAGLVSEQLRG